VEGREIRSEFWVFGLLKNLQAMQSMLKHSIWLVEVCRNFSDGVFSEAFKKDFIGNGICFLKVMHGIITMIKSDFYKVSSW
jgi:hypothetical protein